jgi:hypothetical protein
MNWISFIDVEELLPAETIPVYAGIYSIKRD